jgi:hypothetical protein
LVYFSISGAEVFASTLQKQDYKAAIRKYRKALRYLDVCWEKEEIDEGNYTVSEAFVQIVTVLSHYMYLVISPGSYGITN